MKYSETNLLTSITVIFVGFIIVSFYIRYKFISLHENNLKVTSNSGLDGCHLIRYLLDKLNIDIEINVIDEDLNGNYDPKNKE
ncbi:MAG: hypothetical protein ACOCRO_07980, partial [Halanaerobiales bacterium]